MLLHNTLWTSEARGARGPTPSGPQVRSSVADDGPEFRGVGGSGLEARGSGAARHRVLNLGTLEALRARGTTLPNSQFQGGRTLGSWRLGEREALHPQGRSSGAAERRLLSSRPWRTR